MKSKNRSRMRMAGGMIGQLYQMVKLPVPRSEVRQSKRVVEDDPDASRAAFDRVVDAWTQSVFDADYMRARSFSETEVKRHHELTARGLTALLEHWSRYVGLRNRFAPIPPAFEPMLAAQCRVPIEVSLRAAAWFALYGDRHPALREILRAPNPHAVAAWWESVQSRAAKPFGVRGLVAASARSWKLQRSTVTNVKAGKQLPDDNTIRALAHAIAPHDVSASDGHALSESELRFELRLACVVAQLGTLLEESGARTWQDIAASVFPLAAARLGERQTRECEEVWRHGLDSRSGQEVWAECRATMEDAVRASVARQFAAAQPESGDPRAAFERVAKFFEHGAEAMAEIGAGTGEHMPDGALATTAELFRALAEGRTPRITEADLVELNAEALMQQAIAPWEPRTEDEREELLRRAVASSTEHVGSRVHLADLLRDSGRGDEAIALLEDARRQGIENRSVDERLAVMLLDRGDVRGALEVLGLARDTEGPRLATIRAFCLHESGERDQAEQIARSVVEAHPHYPLARDCLALLLRAAGRGPDAQRQSRYAAFFRGEARPPSREPTHDDPCGGTGTS